MSTLSLHDLHAGSGATFLEVGGAEVVARHGGLAAEYAAAKQGAAVADLSFRELVRVTGPDRVTFLHGMVTHDINGLPEGHTRYTTLLTAKGAMVADARVWRRADELLLDVEPGQGAQVKEALERYLISEDAELHDVTADWAVIGVYGPLARKVLGQALGVEVPALGPDQFAGAGPAQVAAADLVVPGSFELLVPRPALAATWSGLAAAGAVPCGFEALEVLRVEAGVPRFGQDMDEKTIPLEAGLERAISYNKGCYIGQEVIARATFRGHMNRKLAGLTIEGSAAPKEELRSPDNPEKKVGWVTSVVESPAHGLLGLGYVHRDLTAPGTRVRLASGGTATVRAIPTR